MKTSPRPRLARWTGCRSLRLPPSGGAWMLLVLAVTGGSAPGASAAVLPHNPQGLSGRAGGDDASHAPARQADLEQGRQLLGQGAVEEAVALLREAVRVRPADAEAHLLLGRALALLPAPSPALAALRRAVELRPSSADAHYALGTALARFGDAAAARPAFERAIALDPRSADARINLALVLAQTGQPMAARTHLARALEILGHAPAAAYAHYLLAQILREAGETDQALRHLEAAIQRRPQYADAYLSQGLIRSQLRDDRGALEAFEAAVRLDPDVAASRSQLGAAHLRLGQAGAAIPHLQHALHLEPADRAARYHLCRALQIVRRTTEAEACAQALAGRLQADSAESDLTSARANNEGVELEAQGRLTDALERYRAAVALSPSNTVFRRNLGLALCRLGRWQDGIVELQMVLEANPNDQDATRALYIAMEQRGTGQP